MTTAEILNQPDPSIEAAWIAEAKDRLAAYDRGEIKAEPIEELIDKMRSVRKDDGLQTCF
jgi:Putative addiction module component